VLIREHSTRGTRTIQLIQAKTAATMLVSETMINKLQLLFLIRR
jgi:hypothetical protein